MLGEVNPHNRKIPCICWTQTLIWSLEDAEESTLLSGLLKCWRNEEKVIPQTSTWTLANNRLKLTTSNKGKCLVVKRIEWVIGGPWKAWDFVIFFFCCLQGSPQHLLPSQHPYPSILLSQTNSLHVLHYQSFPPFFLASSSIYLLSHLCTCSTHLHLGFLILSPNSSTSAVPPIYSFFLSRRLRSLPIKILQTTALS